MLLSGRRGRSSEGAPAYEDLKTEHYWRQHATAWVKTRPRVAGDATAQGWHAPACDPSGDITEANTRPRVCMCTLVFWRLIIRDFLLSFIAFLISLGLDLFSNFGHFRIVFLSRIFVYIRISFRVSLIFHLSFNFHSSFSFHKTPLFTLKFEGFGFGFVVSFWTLLFAFNWRIVSLSLAFQFIIDWYWFI